MKKKVMLNPNCMLNRMSCCPEYLRPKQPANEEAQQFDKMTHTEKRRYWEECQGAIISAAQMNIYRGLPEMNSNLSMETGGFFINGRRTSPLTH
jgi:hypothetical protein